jgi:hypothetical protein
MNNKRNIFILSSLALLSLASCSNPTSSSSTSGSNSGSASSSASSEEQPIVRVKDERNLSEQEYTTNNIVGKDALNRYVSSVDKSNGKTVGLFYFLWHGSHETGIHDVTQLLVTDPDEVLNPVTSKASPVGEFHYWGQPLYGYYHSADPFVITRHLEEFVDCGVDYLVFDTTNAAIYSSVVESLCTVFTDFQNKGWNVPKIVFYTNSASASTIDAIYNNIYKNNRWSNLYYMVDGKPMIIGVSSDLDSTQYDLYTNYFTFKESQWPDKSPHYSTGFPWMDWGYPQGNYKGTMSVSAAQGPGYNMADPISSWGRGFSYKDMQNSTDRMLEGSNFEEEWQTAINPPDDVGKVTNAFVTGWNEYMAIKQVSQTNQVIYCDQYNEEYSRDMEMENGVLGDNFFMQLARNMRTFKFNEPVHYLYDTHTIDMAASDAWDNVTSNYLDFSGDALKRDYKNCVLGSSTHYVDNSARNDIVKTSITHDKDNLYLRVETKNDITTPVSDDQGWMNVLLNSYNDNNVKFGSNFDFRINAKRSEQTCVIEQYSATGWNEVGNANYTYSGKVLQISLPLATIGKSVDECHIGVKVTDNITTPNDIMNYYVSGDSAPIGRFSYEYGF